MMKAHQQNTNRKGLYIFIALLIFCIGLAVCAMLGNSPIVADYIAVLDIAGTISENDGYTYDQQYLLNSIEEITSDSHNQGLILHIDLSLIHI